jgi:hypothetical protein
MAAAKKIRETSRAVRESVKTLRESGAVQEMADPDYASNSVLKFFQSKREQTNRKEIAIGTVRNHVKSVKLFCYMADLQIHWA